MICRGKAATQQQGRVCPLSCSAEGEEPFPCGSEMAVVSSGRGLEKMCAAQWRGEEHTKDARKVGWKDQWSAGVLICTHWAVSWLFLINNHKISIFLNQNSNNSNNNDAIPVCLVVQFSAILRGCWAGRGVCPSMRVTFSNFTWINIFSFHI